MAADHNGSIRETTTNSTGSIAPSIRGATGVEKVPSAAEIAIVTITKDDPIGIRKTIASVEKQDFPSYEHVVVDGGSTEDTATWLDSWSQADIGRHILIANPPDGIYPAMNLGIESTSAPLILVLNGGDQLLPRALWQVSEHYRLHRWRWAYGGVESRHPNGSFFDHYRPAPFSRRTFRAGLSVVPHPATYVTRGLYQEIGPYREDLGTGADQEFFLRASLVAEPGQLPEILSVFELGGISSQEKIVGREFSWHRMRVASRTAFGGNSAIDLVVTALLLARQIIVVAVRKVANLGTTRKH